MAPVDVEGLPTLSLEDIQDETESQLVARGAAYAREYAAIEDKPTILAMNVATVLLALRKQHDDWLGRSHLYRQVASEVYRQSGVKGDRLTRLQATVRYHVGNGLRRQLTPRELSALELLDTSPLERQQDQRATNSALLAAVKVSAAADVSTPSKSAKPAKKGTQAEVSERVPEQGGSAGMVVRATADHLRLAQVAANIVGQIDTGVIDDHMTDGQRAKLDEELASLQKAITRLRRHTKKPSSKA
ncbi:hypothetical protein ACFVRU_01370 [Streptomyces sp. NPDC057927]